MSDMDSGVVSVRYIVDDVQAAIDFYTNHLGFTLRTAHMPAFADVTRGPLRLLLSGPTSSGARATPSDSATAGRNRVHLIVDDLDAEIERLRRPCRQPHRTVHSRQLTVPPRPRLIYLTTSVDGMHQRTVQGEWSSRGADRMRFDHVPRDVRIGCRVFHQGEDPAGHETGCANRSAAARHLRHGDKAAPGLDLDPAAIPGRDDVIGADLPARINDDLHTVAPHMFTVLRTTWPERRRAARRTAASSPHQRSPRESPQLQNASSDGQARLGHSGPFGRILRA